MIATAMDDTEPVCPICGSDEAARERIRGFREEVRCLKCRTPYDRQLAEHLRMTRPGRKPREVKP